MAAFDLAAYLARLGCPAESLSPDSATLGRLHRHHVQAVPFENLDVLLGHRISTDPTQVFAKLVTARRGGYCFEQNTLFLEILRQIGFAVTPLLARVRWNVPPEVRTPLTHMVLRVEIAGAPWLADVGFGGVGTPAPLRLDTDAEQPTSHEPRRLRWRDGLHVHQVRIGADWRDVYEFAPTEPAPVDFELGNWFSCTHPRAMFTHNLVVTRVTPDGRHSIYNREYTWRECSGAATTAPIASPADLLGLLREKFAIDLPAAPRIEIPAAPW
ncbi:MAG: arylamine N-acetyltransferase family protein [Cephaloticoccus sp.]